MLEFLVSEMGFSIFAIEANMPEAYRLNEYVLEGKGDPARLLSGLHFWTWNTEEVLGMIRWMREFNQSGKGRVQFTGFDAQFPAAALENVREFVAKYDATYVPALEKASVMATSANKRAGQDSGRAGAAIGFLPAGEAAGKHLRLSGWIRTEKVGYGAGLMTGSLGPGGKPLASVNLRGAPKGDTPWKRYSVEVDVPREAVTLVFAAMVGGAGAAWFDGLSIELDGKPYSNNSVDFDFEAPGLKGFAARPGPWSVGPDATVAHSGRQSLRIRLEGPSPGPAEKVEPKAATKTWTDVVAYLESARGAYRGRKAETREIDWAVQNARVVLQCLQGQSGEVSRDRSMADNVKWILDRNPGAKIVLWAHNGHVATTEYLGSELMGAHLRRFYGDQMYVFGFAFNQGSFRAVEASRGLHNFDVAAAPSDSLDARLASTGIPIFALDLRRAPVHGPVADWLDRASKTRSIGAVYSEAAPYFLEMKPREWFDGILFIEKTTAARPNPTLTIAQ
jgi:erythromycin esterase-like protein